MTKLEKICAEAQVEEIIFQEKRAVSKKRIPKKYRDKSLDSLIIKKRTKQEAKILKTLAGVINVPKIYSMSDSEIIMEFVDGKVLKEIIEKQKELCIEAGKEIKKIHSAGIIHGDLTTSNIIYSEKKLFFIDFGLGYFSKKIEDQATDLIVFKKTFNATHSSLKNGWSLVIQGYKPNKDVVERMEKIEKRARYH